MFLQNLSISPAYFVDMPAAVIQHQFRSVSLPTDDIFDERVQWHVVEVRPRREKIVYRKFKEAGANCLLPLAQQLMNYAGTMCRVEVPLYPGYVFIEGNSETIARAVAVEDVKCATPIKG
jgi:hypothetical protein